MTSQFPKRPFKDKVFYLDLRKYRNQDELVKNLKKLGAKVESFLSRDIHYVITDKDICKSKPDAWTPITPKSLICDSPNSFHFHDSIFPSLDSTNNFGSPLNESRNTILSRGLALVQKARAKTSGGTDVVQICNQWNIKIVHIDKVLSVIGKYKTFLAKCRNDENQSPGPMHHGPVERLSAHFVKVEDCGRRYRPQCKNFVNWRDCVDKTLSQFVDTLLSEKLKTNTNLRPLGESQSSNIQWKPQALTPKQTLPQPRQISRILNQAKTIPLSYIKETKTIVTKEKSAKSGRSQSKKKTAKRRYCEICSCSFVSMTEHLQSKEHKSFQRDPSKYKTIADVMSSLPDVALFLEAQNKGSITGDPEMELSAKEEHCGKVMTGDAKGLCEAKNVILPASCCSEEAGSAFPYLEGTGDTKHNNASDEMVCSNKPPLISLNNSSYHHPNNFINMGYDTPPITPDVVITSNYNVKQNMQSRLLFHHQDSVDNKMEVAEAVHRYTTDFPYDASVLNGRVLKKFPFTNFGFGWKSSCEKAQGDLAVSMTKNSNFSDNIEVDECMTDIALSVCRNFEDEDALDLTMTKVPVAVETMTRQN